MIHALNPWGMQWARRCDEQGIDINRNFIDFNQLSPVNPHYAAVRRCYEHEAITERREARASLAQQLPQWAIRL